MKEGDTSFEAFATVCLPRLYRTAHALTGNPEDAWDITQECLVRMSLRWNRIHHDMDEFAYARMTLARLNTDRLRRVGREIRLRVKLASQAYDEADHEDSTFSSVFELLDALTAKQRTAVVLHYMEDLPVVEVSQAMGCSHSAVKTHLSRARSKMRLPLEADKQKTEIKER